MLQAFLFITVFVTCGSSGSGCWTGVSMHSALTSLWVPKSRRSVSTKAVLSVLDTVGISPLHSCPFFE